MSTFTRFVKQNFSSVEWFHLFKDGDNYKKRYSANGTPTIENITVAEYDQLMAEYKHKVGFEMQVDEL